MVWIAAILLAALSPSLTKAIADAWAKKQTARTSSFFDDEKSGSPLADPKRVP